MMRTSMGQSFLFAHHNNLLLRSTLLRTKAMYTIEMLQDASSNEYGTFEAAMRPAARWTGGSVLSFGLNFNRSDGINVDFMNNNDPEDAQITNLINGEWPAPDLVANFTNMEDADLRPWDDFTDVSFSWNESNVAFNVADNMTRSIEKGKRSLSTAGQAL